MKSSLFYNYVLSVILCSNYIIIFNGGMVLHFCNCKRILVYTSLKIITLVAEGCWKDTL
jgi:hypothetical protein